MSSFASMSSVFRLPFFLSFLCLISLSFVAIFSESGCAVRVDSSSPFISFVFCSHLFRVRLRRARRLIIILQIFVFSSLASFVGLALGSFHACFSQSDVICGQMTLSHASPLVQSSASKEARASLTRFIIACSQLFLCFRTNCYDEPLSYVFVSSMFSQSVLPGGPVSQRSLGLVTGPHVGGAEMRRCQARAGASFSVTSSGYSTIPSFSLLSMACARSASAHHYHTFYTTQLNDTSSTAPPDVLVMTSIP
jgi:hypothetical protein